IHKTENMMNLVVIKVHTLALPVVNLQLLAVPILGYFEGQARIDAAQDADEALANMVAGRDLASDVLFAVLGRIEIADFATQCVRLTQGGFLQAGTHLLAVVGEILIGDTLRPEIALQAA